MGWMKWMVVVVAASGCTTRDGGASGSASDEGSSDDGGSEGAPTCDFPYAAVSIRVYYLGEPTDEVDVTYSIEGGPVLAAPCMVGVCNVPEGTGQSITIWAEGFGCTESRTLQGGGGCDATYSPDVQFDFEPNCGADSGTYDETTSSQDSTSDGSTSDGSTSDGSSSDGSSSDGSSSGGSTSDSSSSG
jgi:hypothetical protein